MNKPTTTNTPQPPKKLERFASTNELKQVIASTYQNQIKNFFGDDKKAMRFLSGVVSATQRNPKLLECTPVSVINSFMTMAQLELMPSDVSGEAYILPYNNKKKVGDTWTSIMEAQFQIGYQGLVTLFFRAGAKSVICEIIYKQDKFTYINGVVHHEPDIFAEDRGAPIGAYCIVVLHTGMPVSKVMNAKEILDIGKKFSKSFASDHSPWHEANDPQLWMWRKTVLKQIAKLIPKNERLMQAIAEDNKDSIIGDRLLPAQTESDSLKMGNLITNNDQNNTTENTPENEDDTAQADPNETETAQGGKGAKNK